MNWERHYTGIEIFNPAGNGEGLYVQRNTSNKRITFIRYARRYRFMRLAVYLFLGYMNHLREVGGWGFELAGEHIRVGIALPARWNPLWWKLNPKHTPPGRKWFAYRRDGFNCTTLAWRLGWLCFGFTAPMWVHNWFKQRDAQKWEEAYADGEEYYGAGYEDVPSEPEWQEE